MVMFFASCSSPKADKFLIYGSTECDHCLAFKAQMDSAGLAYEFKDVNGNQELVDEMMAQVKAYHFTEYINLPVVIVNDQHFLSAPSFEQVIEAAK